MLPLTLKKLTTTTLTLTNLGSAWRRSLQEHSKNSKRSHSTLCLEPTGLVLRGRLGENGHICQTPVCMLFIWKGTCYVNLRNVSLM